MDIKELKTKIENNTLNDDVLILKYSDNKFLCNHYVNHIAKNKNMEIQYIDSLSDIQDDNNLFDFNNHHLRVMDVESLSEYPHDDLKNVVIICKNVPKNAKPKDIKHSG